MKTFFQTALFLISFLSFALVTPAVVAHSEDIDAAFADDKPVVLLAQGKKKLTKSEAARQAEAQYGGKAVRVTCQEKADRIYCSVRLDIDGRIKTVTIRG